MKRFFQLLLAGLFLMAVGFISEPKIISVDNDVGASVSIDLQQDYEITNEFEFVSDLSYQEVGIIPTLSTETSLSQAKTKWYKEQLDCIMIIKNRKDFAKSCTDVFYDKEEYIQATNITEFKGTYDWYCSNNYYVGITEAMNFKENDTEETVKLVENQIESWEVIGLVPEPKQEFQNYYI